MSIMQKLNTLFRAGARESAERLTEANAIRIYRQEIVDAENLLEHRRIALAALIATRKDLEKEVETARRRIARREQQIAGIEPEQRCEDLLLVTASDIAATEEHLAKLQQRQLHITAKINTEELTLRKLLTEIKEHHREVKILASEMARSGSASRCNYRNTIAGQLKTLRDSHASISNNALALDTSEASMTEAIERIDGDPVEQALSSQGRDERSLVQQQILARLRAIECPAV